MIDEKLSEINFQTYRKRWFVLLIVVLLNMTGAMIWLTFVAVAYRAAVYYETDLGVINWLSLVFNLSGIFVGALATYVLEKYGLKVALHICAWLSCAGACLRIASTVESFSSSEKLIALFVGQTLAALGQPFCIFAPAKTAATWFPDSERALANTLGAVANPIGVVIAGITAPLFVDSETGELDALNLLITMAAPAAATAILTSLIMTTKKPSIPPSAGALEKGGFFGEGLMEVLKNKQFLILVLAVGGGLGLYSTFATLLEQILCPFGYTDIVAGICAAVMTGCGVLGAAIVGFIVDRNKQFSTMVKLCYLLTTLGLIVFCIVFHIYMDYFILILIAFIGLFSFGIYPIGVELGIEATYPVGAATSSGLIMISGQTQSVVLVLILQAIGRVMSVEETIQFNSQCHTSSDEIATTTTTTMAALFAGGTEAPAVYDTIDLSVSVYVCGGYMATLALILIIFFRPKYNRMAVESNKTENSGSLDDSDDVSIDWNKKHSNIEKPEIVSSV